jgi:branched-chain amino acid transport system permease protein
MKLLALMAVVSVEAVAQSITSGLLYGLVFALVALGLALIWGVADIVNFAHGEYMLIAMYTTIIVANRFHLDPLLLIPVNLIFLFFAGYLSYRLIISKIIDSTFLAQITTTFGILLIIRYGMLYVMGPSTQSVEDFAFSGAMSVYGVNISTPAVAAAIVSTIGITALFLILRYSKIGKAIRATAQDKEVAQVMGIDTDRVYAITWGFGIAAAGLAGTLVPAFSQVHPEITPQTWTFIAFASVALGGFGSVLGAIPGGIVIGLVQHVGGTVLDPSFKDAYVYIVFLAVLVFKPEGIMNWNE